MQNWEENSIEMHFVKPVLFQIFGDDQAPRVESEYSLDKILEFDKDIIITGAPGAGKTSLLRYIKHILQGSNEYCATFVSLRDAQFLNRLAFDNAKNGLITVFLIDGLDEVPILERKEVTRNIEELRNIYPKARFLITSRLIARHEFATLKDYLVLRISELNDSQIEHLFKLHGVVDWRRAFAAIQSSVALRGAARNPFMAKLIIQYIDVIESNDYIVDPTLYIGRLINDYVYKASHAIGIHQKVIDRLLSEIAGFLHYKGTHQLSINDIYSFSNESIGDHSPGLNTDVFLYEMERGYVFRSIRPGVYSFAHMTIFEHFLTKYLRKLVGYRGGKLIFNTSQSVVTAIKLKGLRDRNALRNVLIGIENTLGLSNTQFTPIYAKEGSLEILIVLAVGGAVIHAFNKFSDGFFTKLGHIAAEKNFSDKESIMLPDDIMEHLPPWIRDNKEAMTIFTNELVTQYARNSINDEKAIVSIAINSVLTTQYSKYYERLSLNQFNDVHFSGNKGQSNKDKG